MIEYNITEKIYLCGKMITYRKDRRELLLFPELPKWIIVNNGGSEYLEKINGKLLGEIFTKCDPPEKEFIIKLLEAGVLLTEQEKMSSFNETSTGSYYPLQAVWLNVVSNCNLRCKHCFLGEKEANNNYLNLDEIDRLMEEFILLRGETPIGLDITGGEPLLRKDIIEILKISNREGIAARLITNGLLISPNLIKFLVEESIPIVISLDGSTKSSHEFLRGVNTFEKTVANIKNAVNEGVDLTLSMTVHRNNQQEVFEYFELAQSMGAKKVNFSFLNQIGSAQSNQLQLSREYELIQGILNKAINDESIRRMLSGGLLCKLIETVLLPIKTDCCGTGVNTCAINANGDVFPCPSYQLTEYKGGNIREKTFTQIWTGEDTFRPFRKLDISNLNSECSACELRYFCGGGCRAQAHLSSGKGLQARSNKCGEYKKIFFNLIWMLADHPELMELRTEAGIRFNHA